MRVFTVRRGSTGVAIPLVLLDSRSGTGAGLTGVVYNTAGLTVEITSDLNNTTYTASLANMTRGTWVSDGWAVDGNGVYWYAPPNAQIALAAQRLTIKVYGPANCVPTEICIELVAYDPQNATHLGLAALPNASASASGGLLTVGTGSGQIAPTSGNVLAVLANTAHGGAAASLTLNQGLSITNSAGSAVSIYTTAGPAFSISASNGWDALVVSSDSGHAIDVSSGGINGDFLGRILGGGSGEFAGVGVAVLTGGEVPASSTQIGNLSSTVDGLDQRWGLDRATSYDSAAADALSAATNALTAASQSTAANAKLPSDTTTKLGRLDATITGIPAAVWAVGTRTLSSYGTLAADTATAVWSAGTRTLTSFGALIADIWSNVTRTLTADPASGTGDTLVNHNTGGTDNLRFATSGGSGIDNAEVTAYVKSEYDASASTAVVRGRTFTKTDGRWNAPLKLSAGVAYTIVYNAAGYGLATKDVTP